MTTADERKAASARLDELIALLKASPDTAAILEECEALSRAITAFHMEGIRFRIYNVDRLLTRQAAALPPQCRELLEGCRRHLEASGFHTRSHQAPV